MNQIRITVFRNITDSLTPAIFPFGDVMDEIKKPSTAYLPKAIADIRKAPDHDTKNKLKVATLPVICFSGVFTRREDAALQEYSPLVCLDLDDVQDISNELNRIKTFPYVVAAFNSPSGLGIKVVVLHDNTNPSYHKELYHKLGSEMGFTCRSDLVFDLSCSNVSRACFFSVDRKAYYNPKATPYHFTPDPNYVAPVIKPTHTDITFTIPLITDPTKLRLQIQETHSLFEDYYSMTPGVRNSHLYILARFFRLDGIPEQVSIDYLVAYYADPLNDFPASEITKTVQSAYKNN